MFVIVTVLTVRDCKKATVNTLIGSLNLHIEGKKLLQ